jgi:hypothetical protein
MKKIRKGDVVIINFPHERGFIFSPYHGDIGEVLDIDPGKEFMGVKRGRVVVKYNNERGFRDRALFTAKDLEVIDHIDEIQEPKFKVGEVVADKHFPDRPLPLTVLRVGKSSDIGWTCFLRDVNGVEYGMDEDDLVFYQPRAGDVVVFTSPMTSYYGELGLLVERVGGPCNINGWYIKTGIPEWQPKNNYIPHDEGMYWLPSEFEVIDHIDETPQEDYLSVSQKFEENGYEYWLEQSKDNGLYLMKQCKTCKSMHPTVVRILS